MRHAVLGAGGIGGLVAGALARSGEDVVLLLRPESLPSYPGRLRVESVVLGDFEVAVPASTSIEGGVDVLWVATKATQLESALRLAPPDAVGGATVVPLLNGIDHVEKLRLRYGQVVGAAIRVESERYGSGVIRQKSPFLRVDIAGSDAVLSVLSAAGIECRERDDETTLLWEKLVFLAPIALATTAFDAPLGKVRYTAEFIGCRAEAARAARSSGARIEIDAIAEMQKAAPPEMQSSMQKDVTAGREPETDAIGGPIVRRGREAAFSTVATEELMARTARRSAKQ